MVTTREYPVSIQFVPLDRTHAPNPALASLANAQKPDQLEAVGNVPTVYSPNSTGPLARIEPAAVSVVEPNANPPLAVMAPCAVPALFAHER